MVVVTVVVIPQDEASAELPEGEGCLHFEPNHPATATPKLSSKHLPANTHTLCFVIFAYISHTTNLRRPCHTADSTQKQQQQHPHSFSFVLQQQY